MYGWLVISCSSWFHRRFDQWGSPAAHPYLMVNAVLCPGGGAPLQTSHKQEGQPRRDVPRSLFTNALHSVSGFYSLLITMVLPLRLPSLADIRAQSSMCTDHSTIRYPRPETL